MPNALNALIYLLWNQMSHFRWSWYCSTCCWWCSPISPTRRRWRPTFRCPEARPMSSQATSMGELLKMRFAIDDHFVEHDLDGIGIQMEFLCQPCPSWPPAFSRSSATSCASPSCQLDWWKSSIDPEPTRSPGSSLSGGGVPPTGPKASKETEIYATGFPSVSTMLSPVWSCKASSSSIWIYIGFLPPVCLLVVVQYFGSNALLAGFPIFGAFLFMSRYTYRMSADCASFQ